MKRLVLAGWWVGLILFPISLWAQSVEEGIGLVQKGSIADAKKVFETVLKNNDNNAEAHYRLGLIFMRNDYRDLDESADHMEHAVELNPNSADYQYGYGAALGMKAQRAGVIKQAFLAPKIKSAFQKAVELNPSHLQAHMGLAQYYKQAPGIMGGDMDKAWQEAELIIKLDEVQGRSFKASLYESDKKFAEAEAELKTLVTNQPKDWRSWRNTGFYYLRNKKYDEAISSFSTYVELRPDTADSHARLGQALVQKKDADQAITVSKKALEIDKESGQASEKNEARYEVKRQKKEARETYQWLLNTTSNDNTKKFAEQKIKELQ